MRKFVMVFDEISLMYVDALGSNGTVFTEEQALDRFKKAREGNKSRIKIYEVIERIIETKEVLI